MDIRSHTFDRLRKFFSSGLDAVEYAGLLVIAFATTIAMYQEALVMVEAKRVALADLLLMFLYLEVLAMIGQYFNKDRKNFDPRKYLTEARKAMKEICKARYEAFGCAGQASKIKAVSLEKMADRYKKGELNAIVK